MTAITLEVKLRKRSKTQIELNVDYPLDSDQAMMAHTVDAYLFIPRSLGINKNTYPGYLFYRDLQRYSELVPRQQTLAQMLDSDGGLLSLMYESIARARECQAQEREQLTHDFETAARTFCRFFKAAVDTQLEESLELRGRDVSTEAAETFISLSRKLLHEFRQLREPLQEPPALVEFQPIFDRCDEYLSLLVEDACCRLAHSIRQRGLEGHADLVTELFATARGELDYRIKNAYPSIPDAKRNNEALVYRRKTLRTYIETLYFMTTENKPDSRLARELLLSMAAGISMVFATAATFIAHVRFDNWTTTFFVILVISYMFKDRIKALTQDYLKSRGQRLFHDFRNTIRSDVTGKPLGVQFESFGFTRGSGLDPEIVRRRNRHVLDNIDNDYVGEHNALYRSKSRLYPKRMTDAFPNSGIHSLRQIIRFDFTRFARKMEKSKSRLFIPNETDYEKHRGRYTYHIHLILEFRSASTRKFLHYRIVMSNDGVNRIETVADPDEKTAPAA